MSTKFNRILFDYDGTLIIHDKETEGEIIARLLNIPEERILEFVCRLNYLFELSYGRQYYQNRKMTYKLFYSIMERIMNTEKDFGISVTRLNDVINYKSSYMTELAPHTKDVLEYLKDKGYKLCIFTNGFYTAQVENMKAHGILEYFENIYAWDNFYAKPDSRAVIRALDGTHPKQNVMVGDSITNDILPSKEMGIYTVGINIFEDKIGDVFPDRLITSLKDLKTFL